MNKKTLLFINTLAKNTKTTLRLVRIGAGRIELFIARVLCYFCSVPVASFPLFLATTAPLTVDSLYTQFRLCPCLSLFAR